MGYWDAVASSWCQTNNAKSPKAILWWLVIKCFWRGCYAPPRPLRQGATAPLPSAPSLGTPLRCLHARCGYGVARWCRGHLALVDTHRRPDSAATHTHTHRRTRTTHTHKSLIDIAVQTQVPDAVVADAIAAVVQPNLARQPCPLSHVPRPSTPRRSTLPTVTRTSPVNPAQNGCSYLTHRRIGLSLAISVQNLGNP